MKVAVRYYTRSGHTEKLAKAIADAVHVQAETVATDLTEKVDILFLGCSYYAFDMDEAVKTFIRDNKANIGRVVCFGTSAMMKSMRGPMKKVCTEAGVTLAEEEFHCRGEFKFANKGRPDENDLKEAAAFAKRLV